MDIPVALFVEEIGVDHLGFRRDVRRDDAALFENLDHLAAAADDVEAEHPRARLGEHPIHDGAAAGAHQHRLDRWIFLLERIHQRLALIDAHGGEPDDLTFFFCSLNDLGVGAPLSA